MAASLNGHLTQSGSSFHPKLALYAWCHSTLFITVFCSSLFFRVCNRHAMLTVDTKLTLANLFRSSSGFQQEACKEVERNYRVVSHTGRSHLTYWLKRASLSSSCFRKQTLVLSDLCERRYHEEIHQQAEQKRCNRNADKVSWSVRSLRKGNGL